MEKQAARAGSSRKLFLTGLSEGLPIGLGYFAVAFSLGIAARGSGLTAVQGFVASLFTSASAGEYAVFSLIGEQGTVWETALLTIITNARYFLMSCVLAQKLKAGTGLRQRLTMGLSVTDEFFGVSVGKAGPLEPVYYYGLMLAAVPLWALGTSLGIMMGSLLPARIVNALAVGLFGMFIAVVVPETKKNKVVFGAVALAALFSWLCARLPFVRDLSEGTRTILLTVLISALAAVLFPVKEAADE